VCLPIVIGILIANYRANSCRRGQRLLQKTYSANLSDKTLAAAHRTQVLRLEAEDFSLASHEDARVDRYSLMVIG
jgi:hypothetical protein